jgi:hypothetical protein
MNKSFLRRASALALLVAMSACADREVAPLSAPDVPATGRTIFVALSNLAPAAGDEIVLSVNTLGATGRIGSFKVRLGHTAAGLEFLGAVPQTDGMVIANPVADTLVIVGASGDGFTGSTLASVRVKVLDPAKLGGLTLTVDGITTTDFANQAPTTSVERRLFRGIVAK